MSIIVYKQKFLQPTDRFAPIKNYLHMGQVAMRLQSMKNEDGVHGLYLVTFLRMSHAIKFRGKKQLGM